MKKIILILITALFIGCDTAPVGVQVTFDDEKSNAIRGHYENYLSQDMEGLKSLWSPDIKIFLNSIDQYYARRSYSFIASSTCNF